MPSWLEIVAVGANEREKSFPRSMNPYLRIRFRDSERGREFVVLQPLLMPQQEHGALIVRQE